MMQIRVRRSAGVMMRMQWRGGALLSSADAGGTENWPGQIIPVFRIIGYDGWTGNHGRRARIVPAPTLLLKTAK
jgi:hypothetical protein